MIWLLIAILIAAIIIMFLDFKKWYRKNIVKPVDIEQDEIKIDDLINQQ